MFLFNSFLFLGVFCCRCLSLVDIQKFSFKWELNKVSFSDVSIFVYLWSYILNFYIYLIRNIILPYSYLSGVLLCKSCKSQSLFLSWCNQFGSCPIPEKKYLTFIKLEKFLAWNISCSLCVHRWFLLFLITLNAMSFSW